MFSDENALTMHVIYERPVDYPDKYVVRPWTGLSASKDAFLFDELEEARKSCREKGLIRVERHVTDDPEIVETWL